MTATVAEAIRLYTALLKAYPDYPRNDQVLYQLARAYDTTGQTDLALATLDRIVARYPHDSDLGEVQFRRGELLFSAQHYPQAQQAYEAVLALGPRRLALLPAEPVQARLVAIQAEPEPGGLSSFADLLDYALVDPKDRSHMRSIDADGARRSASWSTTRCASMSISFSYLDGAQSVDQLAASRGHACRMPGCCISVSAICTCRSSAIRTRRPPIGPSLPAIRSMSMRRRSSMAAIEAYRKGGFPDLMLQGKLEYVQRYDFSAPFWQGRARTRLSTGGR